MLEIPPNKIKMSLIGILKIICPVYFIILMNKKTDNAHLVKEGGVKAVLWLVMVSPDWSLVNKAHLECRLDQKEIFSTSSM